MQKNGKKQRLLYKTTIIILSLLFAFFSFQTPSQRIYQNPLSDKFQLLVFAIFGNVCSCISLFLPCSVDIRERDPNAAKRWSDETVFSNRAYFLFDKLPGELAVQNAKDSDTGK